MAIARQLFQGTDQEWLATNRFLYLDKVEERFDLFKTGSRLIAYLKGGAPDTDEEENQLELF